MAFRLIFQPEARNAIADLEAINSPKVKKVRKCLSLLEANPRHLGLHSHEFKVMTIELGGKVWESYVESKTPSAWRVFWHYGPGKDEITILAITPHP